MEKITNKKKVPAFLKSALMVYLLMHGSGGFAEEKSKWTDIGRDCAGGIHNRQSVQRQCKGAVADSTGVPIQGVTVTNKRTNRAIKTDVEGKFVLEAEIGDRLAVSSIGYAIQEATVTSLSEPLLIKLTANDQQLEQVVVTALGIKQRTRSLPYNVQELKSQEITRNKDANFVNALTGKIAGVQINSSSSGIGGATRVIMRGTSSISGNNNALYVIDGIPIPNTNLGNTAGPFEGAVGTEGIASLNPEDIESISALTGPAATALYGNQGGHGVLLVNTKNGYDGPLRINVAHSSDFLSPFVMPRFQNTYGQADPSQIMSWGNKLEKPSEYKPRDFFQTGTNIFNTLSIAGGNEKSQTYFSAGSNNSEGIIRNNKFDRYNATLRHSVQLTDRFTMDFGAMYAKVNTRNMVAQGQYNNPIVPIYLFPPGDDFSKVQVYTRYDPNRLISTQFWPLGNAGLAIQNPYWITDAQAASSKEDRYMLNGSASYKIMDWLKITGRVRMDNSVINNEDRRPAGTDGLFASEFGHYKAGKIDRKNTYLDLIAQISTALSSQINFNANIGGSYQNDQLDGLVGGGNLVRLANFYSTGENTNSPATQRREHAQLQSAFFTVKFDYQNWLFLDATGRQEWPSQLPKEVAKTSTYFYPSVGLSAVISDKWGISKDIISFAKVRASYAQVGNPPRAGIANPTYSLLNTDFRPAPFNDYRPERTYSYEAGVELRFLHDRLSLNATVYQANTRNQLLEGTLPAGNLYSRFYYNAGDVRNRGIEANLGYNGKVGPLNWSSNLVFSLNRNKIINLDEGYVNPYTGQAFDNSPRVMAQMGDDLQNILTVGGTMADYYISKVLREDQGGNLWIHRQAGTVQPTIIPSRKIGSALPDFTLGWNNQFNFNNIDLSFLVDARFGGMGISYTQAVMDAFGVSEQSALDRDQGGVRTYDLLYPDVQGYYNILGNATGGSVGMAAYYTYNATNVRLREASIGYTLPKSLWGGKLDKVRLAVTGRNLFMFYNKAPFDSESTSSTATFGQGIDYFRQPSLRGIGFSIKAQF